MITVSSPLFSSSLLRSSESAVDSCHPLDGQNRRKEDERGQEICRKEADDWRRRRNSCCTDMSSSFRWTIEEEKKERRRMWKTGKDDVKRSSVCVLMCVGMRCIQLNSALCQVKGGVGLMYICVCVFVCLCYVFCKSKFDAFLAILYQRGLCVRVCFFNHFCCCKRYYVI